MNHIFNNLMDVVPDFLTVACVYCAGGDTVAVESACDVLNVACLCPAGGDTVAVQSAGGRCP